MVSHHRRTHPVIRQSQGITRRRETVPNVFTRLRVLTPAEINQRLLENWNFIQIETVQNIDNTPPPLLIRTPDRIHESGPPGQDIIEYPLQREPPVLNEPEPSTSYAPQTAVHPPALNAISEEPISLFKDYDEQETIPFTHNINFEDLLNQDEYGDLYEPISELLNKQTSTDEELTLSQLLREVTEEPGYDTSE